MWHSNIATSCVHSPHRCMRSLQASLWRDCVWIRYIRANAVRSAAKAKPGQAHWVAPWPMTSAGIMHNTQVWPPVPTLHKAVLCLCDVCAARQKDMTSVQWINFHCLGSRRGGGCSRLSQERVACTALHLACCAWMQCPAMKHVETACARSHGELRLTQTRTASSSGTPCQTCTRNTAS
jgi:hypothetical protein